MGDLVSLNGKKIGRKAIDIRKWQRGSKKACDGLGICEGMTGLLSSAADEKRTRVTAVGTVDELQRGDIDGIGQLVYPKNELFLFNFCPACGGKLNLPANKRA